MQVFREFVEAVGSTPLPVRYYTDPSVTIDQLPQKGFVADVEKLQIDRRTFFECLNDDRFFPLVNAFLFSGLDVNAKRASDGATALHVAAGSGGTETEDSHFSFGPQSANNVIVSFLIDNGARVDEPTNEGKTPLMCAAEGQNVRAIKLLLAKGADLHRKDQTGRSCLSYASTYPHVLQSLRLWYGEDLKRCAEEEFLLHRTCLSPQGARATYYLQEELELPPLARLSRSAAAALGVTEGLTPLQCAVSTGVVSVVKAALSGMSAVTDTEARGATVRAALQNAKTYSAGAAKGQQVERAKVVQLLERYVSANTPEKQEQVAEENESVSLYSKNSPLDAIEMVMALVLPHAILYGVCALFHARLLELGAMFLAFMVWFTMTGKDGDRVGKRPLRSLGWTVGILLALYWAGAQQYGTLERLQRLRAEDAQLPSVSYSSLFTFRVWFLLTVAALAGVLFISPGVVKSSRNQRRAIYLALQEAQGNSHNGGLSDEVVYSIDMRRMVKKPLRAQYCHHLEQVVLRLDHYAPHVASTVGAYNHRLFVFFHIILLWWATYVRSYGIALDLMLREAKLTPEDTAATRLIYLYASYLSIVVFLLSLWIVVSQVFVLRRNLTNFDLSHAHTLSSLYCFVVAGTTFSLYDKGAAANLLEFFLFIPFRRALTYLLPFLDDKLPADDFTKISYRIPQMGEALKKTVQEAQRWEVSQAQGACGHDHGGDEDHGHSHGEQPQQAPPNILFPFGQPNTTAAAAPESDSVLVELETDGHQPATEAHRRAEERSREMETKYHLPAELNPVRVPEEGDGGCDNCGGEEEEMTETVATLAQAIFQEMISVGGSQRYEELHGLTEGYSLQDAGPRKRDWFKGVKRAKEMYQFFTASMQQQQQDFLHSYQPPSETKQ
ncbi:huntingtin interacting protein (HIP) [Angomonas deanei]|uniref:Palmitoyltransferase n=1 Tax=Angomonas deanei TaxID=59799 RepID=A0A7G2CMB7_9TRYP|nr:huntingtin interacting protein (HIP) [Angomonas deanei]CAD2220207.1 Ankyrin repeats (3 copies)/Ankyrin repeat/DHHC palmitoyltransferase, putative [Angomonas deanei]|eukprot:EPY19849.1 huntingtin interacting protein (HIP) [Angomonas deanei]